MAKLGQYAEQFPTMTAQEVFNATCDHLIKQGKQSLSIEDKCVYNGPNDTCCAAAIFIKDYNRTMEGCSWEELVKDGQSPNNEYLVSDLQVVHDMDSSDSWKEALTKVAREYNLEIPSILKE